MCVCIGPSCPSHTHTSDTHACVPQMYTNLDMPRPCLSGRCEVVSLTQEACALWPWPPLSGETAHGRLCRRGKGPVHGARRVACIHSVLGVGDCHHPAVKSLLVQWFFFFLFLINLVEKERIADRLHSEHGARHRARSRDPEITAQT